ncbi:MAG: hypothetical protein COX29_02210 [Candidatus Moranbacteria bacterium CG23_combo_of_CG06-09_8_20_14_all_35_22]|nr:MAG: hypothetical protein COX29_02210 [Candidatus Moranbacteria bacterium CG23_combo_of_CG06-09_8_20_14_all_35_22]
MEQSQETQKQGKEQKIIEPEKRKGAEVIDLDQKRQEMRERKIQKEYAPIFEFRKKIYARDIAQNQAREVMLSNLETHNKIVLDDAINLIESEKLSPEDRVATIIAIIMHDSGKLSSDILSHHEKGIEYVDEMFGKMEKTEPEFEGIRLTDEIRQKIIWAIERHMNHPYLVGRNGGEKFPEPENSVDKVVFDADMLANIGFKNIGFRLASEDYLREDKQKAIESRTNSIEETFKNVMQDVVKLDGIVLSFSAKKVAKERIEDAKRIFDYLKENKIFKNILEKVSNISEKLEKDRKMEDSSVILTKNLLNEEISKAGMALGIDDKTLDKLKM